MSELPELINHDVACSSPSLRGGRPAPALKEDGSQGREGGSRAGRCQARQPSLGFPDCPGGDGHTSHPGKDLAPSRGADPRRPGPRPVCWLRRCISDVPGRDGQGLALGARPGKAGKGERERRVVGHGGLEMKRCEILGGPRVSLGFPWRRVRSAGEAGCQEGMSGGEGFDGAPGWNPPSPSLLCTGSLR